MCTPYLSLDRHSVEAGIAKAEEAEGGAPGGFAEKGFVEGVMEGRILKDVAEEGIYKNEPLEKIRAEIAVGRGITLSVGEVDEGLGEGVAEAVVVEAVVTEEDAAENGDRAAKGDGDNGGDNIDGKDEAKEQADVDGDGNNADDDYAEGHAENEDEAENAWADRFVGGDGVVVGVFGGGGIFGGDGVFDGDGAFEGGSGNVVEVGVDHVGDAAGHTSEEDLDATEAIKEGGVGEGGVREEGIVEGVITDGGITQGIAKKGVTQGVKEWDIREGIV